MSTQWPFIAAVAVMAMAGISQSMLRRIPNALTMFCFLLAILACLITPSPMRAAGLALLCAVCSLAAMIPAYGRELPAGSIKAQMSFGAWLGVGMSFGPNTGVSLSLACALIAYIFMMMCLKSDAVREALTYEQVDVNEPEAVQRMFQVQLPLSLANGVCVIGYLLQL